MATKITMRLSSESVNNAITQLRDYQKQLNAKVKELVKALTNEGYQIAVANNEGTFSDFITFTKMTEEYGYVTIGYLIGSGKEIPMSYKTQDGVKTLMVNSLLMSEFGSGQKAQNPMNVSGVGQGTFPGQIHANDPNGWYFMTLDGKWVHSNGYAPHAPMFKASEAIIANYEAIVRQVFRG